MCFVKDKMYQDLYLLLMPWKLKTVYYAFYIHFTAHTVLLAKQQQQKKNKKATKEKYCFEDLHRKLGYKLMGQLWFSEESISFLTQCLLPPKITNYFWINVVIHTPMSSWQCLLEVVESHFWAIIIWLHHFTFLVFLKSLSF